MFSVTKNKVWLLLLPIVLILAGVVGLIVNGGFREDIDFAGGTSMQINIGKTLSGAERDELGQTYAEAAGIEITPIVQTTGQNFDQVVVKSTVLTEEQQTAAFTAVKDKYGLADEAMMSVSSQDASYGNEMKFNTLLFSLIAAVLMLIYISIRFEWKRGVMAVAALAINVLVMLSVYALFGIPLSTTFIAAILTVLGYSINDTIVIFDRIRENMKYSKKETATEITEKSIWQTMTRYDQYVAYDVDYDRGSVFHGSNCAQRFCTSDHHWCCLRFLHLHFRSKPVVGCLGRCDEEGAAWEEKGGKGKGVMILV